MWMSPSFGAARLLLDTALHLPAASVKVCQASGGPFAQRRDLPSALTAPHPRPPTAGHPTWGRQTRVQLRNRDHQGSPVTEPNVWLTRAQWSVGQAGVPLAWVAAPAPAGSAASLRRGKAHGVTDTGHA